MRTTRRAALAVLAAPAIAGAQPTAAELVVGYPNPVVFREPMQRIAALFEQRNPGLRLILRAPEEDYEAMLQRTLRDVVTRSLPDVSLQGLNRQRTLLERDLAVDLGPLLAADPGAAALGYSPSLLTMGQVGGRQVGVGFAISTPILYWNAALVRRAGGDPARLPSDWDGVVALARAIHGDGATGMFFDWTITGNWLFQALVLSHGGGMMDAEETRVAFADPPGRAGLRALRRMVEEGRMPDLRAPAAVAEFNAGRLGLLVQSTARLGAANRDIAGRFPLVCSPFPLSAPAGRVPAGGAVAMLHARDPVRQRLAWEFLKLATGPEGATVMVNHTGYMPATTAPASRGDMLAGFYRDNPNHLVSLSQQPVMTGWYAFPGQNALRITDAIQDHLQSVVSRRAEPDAAADAMARDVTALLPRRRA